MKRTIAAIAGLAVLLAGCTQSSLARRRPTAEPAACTTQSYSPAEIFQNAAPSIVVVAVGKSLGSGFVIKQDKRYTYILTNSHVVVGADEVKVKWSDDREETGKVISDHGGETWQKDLALVRVDAVRGIPLKFKEKPPAVGEDVVVIGAPQGLEFSLSRGVMSQLRNNGDFLQVDAPVNPGNSGGPLFDKTGCVVGVVTFKDEDSEGINFAIGYGPTKHFLENPAIERAEPKPEPVASEPQQPREPQEQQSGWVSYHIYDDGDYLNSEDYQLLSGSIRREGHYVYFRHRRILLKHLLPAHSQNKIWPIGGPEEGNLYVADCGNYSFSWETRQDKKAMRHTFLKQHGYWDHVKYPYQPNERHQNRWNKLHEVICRI